MASSPAVAPKGNDLSTLTSLRMDPHFSPIIDDADRNATLPDNDDESASDDGSDVIKGDTYLPIVDDSNDENTEDYNKIGMEEDGTYDDFLSGLKFLFGDLDHELSPPVNMYNGKGPCLHHGVSKKFNTIFECVSVAGGMDYEFFKRLTANSNEYARLHMSQDGEFGGSKWSNISVQEMIRFHGMILKMSIDDRELGGYTAYFTEEMSVNCSRSFSVKLTDYMAWGLKIMSLRRFKQIRASFHSEVGTSKVGDKCHQLRHALNTLNAASMRTFIPGIDLSFDEGGVASRSRFNPVRQYNKDKPQKFRVDFFVLCNNSPGMYFIIHCDVYQGKNAANIGIP